jgi:hypothetical protein
LTLLFAIHTHIRLQAVAGDAPTDSGPANPGHQSSEARRGYSVHPQDSGSETDCFVLSSGGGNPGRIGGTQPFKGNVPQPTRNYAPNNTTPPTKTQRFQKWALNKLCGTSPENKVESSMVDGAVSGGLTGALEGGFGGGILTGGPGGVPGTILGGWVGGVFGGTSGIVEAPKWLLFAQPSTSTNHNHLHWKESSTRC